MKTQNCQDPLTERNELPHEDNFLVEQLGDSTNIGGVNEPVKFSNKFIQIFSIIGLLININSKQSDLDIFLDAFQKLFRDEHGKALIWRPAEEDLEEE